MSRETSGQEIFSLQLHQPLTLPPLRTKKSKQQQRKAGREPGAVSCEIIPV